MKLLQVNSYYIRASESEFTTKELVIICVTLILTIILLTYTILLGVRYLKNK